MVTMESTDSYWKPLYNIPESSSLATMVVSAAYESCAGQENECKREREPPAAWPTHDQLYPKQGSTGTPGAGQLPKKPCTREEP